MSENGFYVFITLLVLAALAALAWVNYDPQLLSRLCDTLRTC
jgi:hypothetical protein